MKARAIDLGKCPVCGQRCTTADDVVQLTAHDYVHSACARESAKEGAVATEPKDQRQEARWAETHGIRNA